MMRKKSGKRARAKTGVHSVRAPARRASTAPVRAAPLPPVDAAEARDRFETRTGIDPMVDSITGTAVVLAATADVLLVAQQLNSWMEPLRAALTGRDSVPAIPKWVRDVLAAMVPKEPRVVADGTGPAGEGESQDLVKLLDDVHKQVTALKQNGCLLQQMVAELMKERTDRGVQGRFLDPAGPGRAAEAGKRKFARRLVGGWAIARRPRLDAETVALLAVGVGLEPLPVSGVRDETGASDWERVIESWRVYLRRHKPIGVDRTPKLP